MSRADPSLIDSIYHLLRRTVIPYGDRFDGKFRYVNVGMILPRIKYPGWEQPRISRFSVENKEVWEEVMELGHQLCPFEFTSVTIAQSQRGLPSTQG